MEEIAIRLQDLRKSFGETTAVAGVDLEIRDGEFFSMLGPSGSGKTTVLRLIAGFETPGRGRIELAGQEVTGLAPFERDVHTVFQDYALFPHMTVEQNVAYGLKVRKVPKAERLVRARKALAEVRLEGYGQRRPAQLSGGQRQRVALARALVGRPRVLLLDEPLGALDLKLRERMQVELKALQREVGITFVFVTHDQEEALTMSDRIAVFDQGRIAQVGTPAEIYERPATAFVASFVGTSNLVEGEAAQRMVGAPGTYTIRPEKIRVLEESAESDAPEHATATGTVAEVVYLGEATRFLVDLDGGGRLTALQQNLDTSSADVAAYRGARVRLRWHRRHAVRIPS
ncbi:putative spermidine/putrescine transport system ATP-binding protein [Streptomyces griseochromogenes]|uniref:Spermidine/putrescine ABC transporter ATP-binding protein n=1 Tax=Streptomyces griseochromogenes TaxID=68214 RepID=A0A1B1B187_9ACTN|nr:ABC transporter ATP-binding protein [Streptomyces griseochromogenes]ANP52585.1 spermidine/putrescine ABC transporter ATP-binding protein [Streptomyces griseochromogenes]MBP2047159.1 putative spermidine/putrescine transport system ATP-binding protein [Streptomyces griseochromogenes]